MIKKTLVTLAALTCLMHFSARVVQAQQGAPAPPPDMRALQALPLGERFFFVEPYDFYTLDSSGYTLVTPQTRSPATLHEKIPALRPALDEVDLTARAYFGTEAKVVFVSYYRLKWPEENVEFLFLIIDGTPWCSEDGRCPIIVYADKGDGLQEALRTQTILGKFFARKHDGHFSIALHNGEQFLEFGYDKEKNEFSFSGTKRASQIPNAIRLGFPN